MSSSRYLSYHPERLQPAFRVYSFQIDNFVELSLFLFYKELQSLNVFLVTFNAFFRSELVCLHLLFSYRQDLFEFMSVVIETSLGEMVFDLFTQECPKASENFLKLCKMKYYNNVIFHKIEKNFVAQCGDPSGTGTGGSSIYSQILGPSHRFFPDEIHSHLRHNKVGLLCMNNMAPNENGSGFYITLSSRLEYLDGKHTIFGELVEGQDTLTRLNAVFCDAAHRPYQNVRVKHTSVLVDPFPDPPQLDFPATSPLAQPDQFDEGRLRADDRWEDEFANKTPEEIRSALRAKEARSRANILAVLGDLPDADVSPPDNVLFVCKLNSLTEDEDLALIFSRYGNVVSCEVVRDKSTGNSLKFAFVEMETSEQAERAFTKLNNAIIDDRRIKVDFSQSVSKLWNNVRREKKDQNQRSDGGKGTSTRIQESSQASQASLVPLPATLSQGEKKTITDLSSTQTGGGIAKKTETSERSRVESREQSLDRRRERSPDRRRERSPDRRRERSPDRYHNREQNRDGYHGRNRERSRDRYRDQSRDRYRDKSRDRYRDQDRDQNRDRSHDKYQNRKNR